MAECSVCGNDYGKAFVVTTVTGQQWTFDSIECAAHAIAPRCARQWAREPASRSRGPLRQVAR